MYRRNSVKDYVFLYSAFLLYSLSSVMGKLASQYEVASMCFLGLYMVSLAILGIYAILWQSILKRFDFVTAYSNRQITTILGVVWGVLLFHEPLTWNMVVGSIVMMIGMRLVAIDDAE